MPFMPAVSLNQWSGALPRRGLCFPAEVFSVRFAFPPLFVSAVLQFNLLAFDNVCCPNASFVLLCSV